MMVWRCMSTLAWLVALLGASELSSWPAQQPVPAASVSSSSDAEVPWAFPDHSTKGELEDLNRFDATEPWRLPAGPINLLSTAMRNMVMYYTHAIWSLMPFIGAWDQLSPVERCVPGLLVYLTQQCLVSHSGRQHQATYRGW